MKKLVVLLAALAMLLSFTGCKMNRDDEKPQSGADNGSVSSTQGDTSGSQNGTDTPGSTGSGM